MPSATNNITPLEEDINTEEISEKLNELNIPEETKQQILQNVTLIKVIVLRKQAGLPLPLGFSHNFAMYGKNEKAKAEFVHLMGQIFKSAGILTKGHVVEVTAADLIEEKIGYTSRKTAGIIESALDGVLYIKNAHELDSSRENEKRDFNQDALDTLWMYMDGYYSRLIVILSAPDESLNDFIGISFRPFFGYGAIYNFD